LPLRPSSARLPAKSAARDQEISAHGKHLHQVGRLHARQPRHRINDAINEAAIATPTSLTSCSGKTWNGSPSEGFHVDDRNQAPRHAEPERERQKRRDQRDRHGLGQFDSRKAAARHADAPERRKLRQP